MLINPTQIRRTKKSDGVKPARACGYSTQGNIMNAAVTFVFVPKMVIADAIVFLLPKLL